MEPGNKIEFVRQINVSNKYILSLGVGQSMGGQYSVTPIAAS